MEGGYSLFEEHKIPIQIAIQAIANGVDLALSDYKLSWPISPESHIEAILTRSSYLEFLDGLGNLNFISAPEYPTNIEPLSPELALSLTLEDPILAHTAASTLSFTSKENQLAVWQTKGSETKLTNFNIINKKMSEMIKNIKFEQI